VQLLTLAILFHESLGCITNYLRESEMVKLKIVRSKIVLIGLFMGSFSSGSVEGASQFVMCKNKDIVRTIRVEETKAEDYSCETIYTKAGTDRIVGQAKSTYSCTSVLNNIKENLVGAGWSCKEVPGARVTAGSGTAGE
jgi:hypothetical protein